MDGSLAPRLREALGDTPAVLIHGPRQSGKTTLARAVGEPRGYRYVPFDDDAIRADAKSEPVGFVNGLPAKTILDEVQRVPELFTSLKTVIDQRRTKGRHGLGALRQRRERGQRAGRGWREKDSLPVPLPCFC